MKTLSLETVITARSGTRDPSSGVVGFRPVDQLP
jgi:hypothetical protein